MVITHQLSSLRAMPCRRPQLCYPPAWFSPRSLSAACIFASFSKKKVVFLGSPKVAARVLDQLLLASQADMSQFEIAAVVAQPPAPKGRGQKLMPSSVVELAMEKSFMSNHIFCPKKAGEEDFLARLRDLKPDLCITAAYGNILPTRFLKIPTYGTVNIHPSLLPLYRGASPVQRAIEDGVQETGVTVAFTVRAMDAGPIIASETVVLDEYIKAPELLQLLFDKGVRLLLRELPSILDGTAAQSAKEQDHSRATHARKVTADEAWLDFTKHAVVLHNKVRALAEWPGTKGRFQVMDSSGAGRDQTLDLKIITTRPCTRMSKQDGEKHVVMQEGLALVVPCEGESALEILELQPSGKRIMAAKDFMNGLRGQQLRVVQNNSS